jgi:hypothetical protein
MPWKQQGHRNHKSKRRQRGLPLARPLQRLSPAHGKGWARMFGTSLQDAQWRSQRSVHIGAQAQPELQGRA